MALTPELQAKVDEIQAAAAAAEEARNGALDIVAQVYASYAEQKGNLATMRGNVVAVMDQLNGFTIPQIAEAFGCSEATISTLRAENRKMNNVGPVRNRKGKGKGSKSETPAEDGPAE